MQVNINGSAHNLNLLAINLNHCENSFNILRVCAVDSDYSSISK